MVIADKAWLVHYSYAGAFRCDDEQFGDDIASDPYRNCKAAIFSESRDTLDDRVSYVGEWASAEHQVLDGPTLDL